MSCFQGRKHERPHFPEPRNSSSPVPLNHRTREQPCSAVRLSGGIPDERTPAALRLRGGRPRPARLLIAQTCLCSVSPAWPMEKNIHIRVLSAASLAFFYYCCYYLYMPGSIQSQLLLREASLCPLSGFFSFFHSVSTVRLPAETTAPAAREDKNSGGGEGESGSRPVSATGVSSPPAFFQRAPSRQAAPHTGVWRLAFAINQLKHALNPPPPRRSAQARKREW